MKKHLLSALFCLFVLTLQASERLNFRTFDVKSGIADNYVQSILCDRYGFMWFSTLNGLSRYDGYQFKTYTTTQLGAYNNDIEFTAEDASGTIWIKTPKSYYFYNREKDEIDDHITPILEQFGIYGTPDNLYIDKDLNLWCTVNSTLYYYVFRQKELYTEPPVGQRKFLTVRQKFDRILAVEKDGKERKRYGTLLVEGSMKFSLLTFFFKRK